MPLTVSFVRPAPEAGPDSDQFPLRAVGGSIVLPSYQLANSGPANLPPHVFRVECRCTAAAPAPNKEAEFPGLVALDFGTSSSTVTVWSPRLIETPEGFPPEQQERLVQLVTAGLLDEAGGGCRVPGVGPEAWSQLLADLQ